MPPQYLGRILVVDDETELTTILCETLSAQGYQAVGFSSANEALAALKRQEFDLILADLMMPEMNGIALLRQALELDAHLVGIIMTGQGTVQTAVEAMKVGAFDYILKPFKLATILPVLDHGMEVRRLRMENVQLRETVAIYELSTAISHTLDLTTLLDKTIDAVLQQLSANEASIMLPTSDGRGLYVAVTRGDRPERILGKQVSMEQGIAGWVARHQESVTLFGAVNDPRFAPVFPRPDIGSAVSMPVLVGGKLVGVLNANLTHRQHPPTLGQIKALNILASTAGGALESAQLYNQVRQAEEEYRSIFENSHEGIFRVTPAGRLIIANPVLAHMLGYASPADLMAITDIQNQIFVDPQRRIEYDRQMADEGYITSFEFQAKRLDGSLAWLSENARTVRNERGAMLYYEGSIQDITSRKQAEEALVWYAHRLEVINRLDRIITSNLDFTKVYDVFVMEMKDLVSFDWTSIQMFDEACDQWQTILQWTEGIPALQSAGWQPLQGTAFEWVAHQRKVLLEDYHGKPPPWTEPQSLQEEGIQSRALFPLITEGKVIGILTLGSRQAGTYSENVAKLLQLLADQLATAVQNSRLYAQVQQAADRLEERVRQRTAQLEQANNELKSFSYSVSHDLRAPLRAINGFTQLLLQDYRANIDQVGQHYMDNVIEACTRMETLIDDMLKYSRLGRVSIQHQPVSLDELFLQVLQDLSPRIDETKGSVKLPLTGTMPLINSDTTLLGQIFTNIIGNALIYHRPNIPPEVSVDYQVIDHHYLFNVSDNGIGIPAEFKEKIFNVFERLHNLKEYPGTGIGLAIVKKAVDLLDGKVWVDSIVGQGSTFWVQLPIE